MLHELYKVLDVGSANVDNCVIKRLQILLQFAELLAANGCFVGSIRVDRLNWNNLSVIQAWGEKMAGDSGLTDIAREVDNGDFHLLILLFATK